MYIGIHMGNDWILDCECCNKRIKKILDTDTNKYENFDLDGMPHQKHYKIWASSVPSFMVHGPKEQVDADASVNTLTIGQLDDRIHNKVAAMFGTWLHAQSGYTETWLKPRKFVYKGIDYYVAGNVDGEDKDKKRVIELKTTMGHKTQTIRGIIHKAEMQADIYSWIAGYTEARIIVKSMSRPAADAAEDYKPMPGRVEELLATYIDQNHQDINQY